jgi:hypothetical protein
MRRKGDGPLSQAVSLSAAAGHREGAMSVGTAPSARLCPPPTFAQHGSTSRQHDHVRLRQPAPRSSGTWGGWRGAAPAVPRERTPVLAVPGVLAFGGYVADAVALGLERVAVCVSEAFPPAVLAVATIRIAASDRWHLPCMHTRRSSTVAPHKSPSNSLVAGEPRDSPLGPKRRARHRGSRCQPPATLVRRCEPC